MSWRNFIDPEYHKKEIALIHPEPKGVQGLARHDLQEIFSRYWGCRVFKIALLRLSEAI